MCNKMVTSNRARNRQGFTLVELIIVIAVIGVLAAILIPTFANVIDKANRKSALSDAKNAATNMVDSCVDKGLGGVPDMIFVGQKGSGIYVNAYSEKFNGVVSFGSAFAVKTTKALPSAALVQRAGQIIAALEAEGYIHKLSAENYAKLADYVVEANVLQNQELFITLEYTIDNIFVDGTATSGGVKPEHGGIGGGSNPGTNPSNPGTDPADPGTDPVDPGTDPVDPGTDPVDPGTDPVDPGTDPVDPGTDPEVIPEGYIPIYTAEEFKAIPTTGMNKNYIVMNDIDFGGDTLTPLGNGSATASGITSGTKFTGIFDGNGHKFSNFSINNQCYSGLFFWNEGTIKNLYAHVNPITVQACSGIIAGLNDNTGKILNCGVSGTINPYWTESFDYYYGGMTKRGSSQIGGVVGDFNGGTVDQCWSNVIINGTSGNNYMGGIAGYCNGTMSNCITFGKVYGSQSGSHIGYADANIKAQCLLSLSYVDDMATSNTSTKQIYGSGGFSQVSASNCFGIFYLKGLVYRAGTYYSGWDTQGTAHDHKWMYGKMLLSSEFVQSTFTDVGWSTDIWDFSGTYPVLKNAAGITTITVQPPVTPAA